MLSRQTAGLRGKTLILNLPGKPKAIRETIDEVSSVASNLSCDACTRMTSHFIFTTWIRLQQKIWLALSCKQSVLQSIYNQETGPFACLNLSPLRNMLALGEKAELSCQAGFQVNSSLHRPAGRSVY